MHAGQANRRLVALGVDTHAGGADVGRIRSRVGSSFRLGGGTLGLGAGPFGVRFRPGGVGFSARGLGAGAILAGAGFGQGFRQVGAQTVLEALQGVLHRAAVQGHQVQGDFGPAWAAIDAGGAIGAGRALAGQNPLGLRALQGVDHLQDPGDVLAGRSRGDAHRAAVVTGGGHQREGAGGPEEMMHGRLLFGSDCARKAQLFQ
ncbi:hypothetical protein D3C72_760120 [compost metagenome]